MRYKLHLTIATISFALCFMAWGLISGLAPTFKELLGLTRAQTAALIAVPVLLGALARLPIGMLTDRFGGRLIFTILLFLSAAVCAAIPSLLGWPSILIAAFVLGLSGSSFSVGVGYVSRWAPAQQQGSVLGLYGLGNIGQSLAVFLSPLVADRFGWPSVFYSCAAVIFVWAIVFGFIARDAPVQTKSSSLSDMCKVLMTEKLSWLLALFYFLTFGGFIAFAIYLPTLLIEEFTLVASDAGIRAAGFVVLATLMRPVGGWLADKIGGAKVLSSVFLGITIFAPLLAWPAILPFTVGALGCAVFLGLGNGAVFKLVPEIFPKQVATVGGLVGALGGLGGFFPPVLLGASRQYLGVMWPCFALLAALSFFLYVANQRVFVSRQEARDLKLPPVSVRTAEQVRAGFVATIVAGVLVAAIVIGSRKLQNFDPALVIYTFATIFAVWGVTYHYYVWLQKPPTKRYWQRGWQLFFQEIPRSVATLSRVSITHLFAQTFIARRSKMRWITHLFLAWGCTLAAAVTFPLVFGWIHFGTLPNDQTQYVPHIFGFATLPFHVHSVFGWIMFHILDIAAVMVIIGVVLSLFRRMRDQGAQAVQSFAMDFVPLIMLFAISLTGIALTVANICFDGIFYDFLSILHAITVVAALIYLPFGKFFHIFQRPAQLGVKLFQDVGARDPGAFCARCGERFASRMQIDDLNLILPQLGFDYSMPGPAQTWQEICPPCKRISLASAQLRLKETKNG
ncbi:NarK/NasA family nitrate transporter [bacterium]|nr:NarK/NasA family nitrate transporter [bacterium]MBP9807062.1 NarK/NasA family nitrate transporter [bacterium]